VEGERLHLFGQGSITSESDDLIDLSELRISPGSEVIALKDIKISSARIYGQLRADAGKTLYIERLDLSDWNGKFPSVDLGNVENVEDLPYDVEISVDNGGPIDSPHILIEWSGTTDMGKCETWQPSLYDLEEEEEPDYGLEVACVRQRMVVSWR
jgi:hypothetical protein